MLTGLDSYFHLTGQQLGDSEAFAVLSKGSQIQNAVARMSHNLCLQHSCSQSTNIYGIVTIAQGMTGQEVAEANTTAQDSDVLPEPLKILAFISRDR